MKHELSFPNLFDIIHRKFSNLYAYYIQLYKNSETFFFFLSLEYFYRHSLVQSI